MKSRKMQSQGEGRDQTRRDKPYCRLRYISRSGVPIRLFGRRCKGGALYDSIATRSLPLCRSLNPDLTAKRLVAISVLCGWLCAVVKKLGYAQKSLVTRKKAWSTTSPVKVEPQALGKCFPNYDALSRLDSRRT